MTQQSPNWDKHKDTRTEVPYSEGFPHDEGFPTMYGDKLCEIVVRSGEHYSARVNDSREFASEGLEWTSASGKSFTRSIVVAWRELEEGDVVTR